MAIEMHLLTTCNRLKLEYSFSRVNFRLGDLFNGGKIAGDEKITNV